MSSDFAHEVVIHCTLKSSYERLLTFIAWTFDVLVYSWIVQFVTLL